MQPTCRQVSVGSLQNSDAIFEKWNLPSTLFTITNEYTRESTASMIPKKSIKIEQEIIPIASPSSCVSNRSVSTTTTTTRSTTSSDESSQEGSEEECFVHQFDAKSFDPFDLAEFEGFTFYHLEEEQQRCCEEEFDIKFKFTPTIEADEVRQQTYTLLNELEKGHEQNDYGIPEMTFDTSDM